MAGVLTTLVALSMVASLAFAPTIPALHPEAEARPHTILPAVATTKAERRRLALRNRLRAALLRFGETKARRPEQIALVPLHTKQPAASGQRVVAGFFVNWDDNSFASLQLNHKALDWVVAEWGFVARGGDSLRFSIDRKVFDASKSWKPEERPAILLMVSNFDSTRRAFSVPDLRAMLSRPEASAKAIAQLRALVQRYDLGGVTLDFEAVPPDLEMAALDFSRQLHDALAPMGKLTTEAVPTFASDSMIRRIAAVTDRIFPMIFDEHYQGGDPGPVASQQFYVTQLRRFARLVPPAKLVPMIGAYGYDWNDALPPPGQPKSAETMTFQEVVAAARDSGAVIRMDPATLNPFATWSSPDSVDHVVWYLDATSAYNQILAGQALGTGGVAIWRLGGEDPALWRVLGDDGKLGDPQALATVPASYMTEIVGQGELLRVSATPADGTRQVTVDPRTGYVTAEHFTRYPSPYVVTRFGADPGTPPWEGGRKIALTFDDGPDGRWTPMILDTLRAHHAPATFFVIGENADAHLALLRRIYREGHEVGNHTYTHPNMALVNGRVARLEMDATERLIEAALNRRTALFRPPYFGDAEPTTVPELKPVSAATARGYQTVGLHLDSEDWVAGSTSDSVLKYALAARDYSQMPGNVLLMHDGGGDRTATVAALGPLIDSLRARGDTLVLVSELGGIPRDAAMPPLTTGGQLRRLAELGGFWVLGAIEWLLYWVFFLAVILGVARLAVIGVLALVQRLKRHQERGLPTPFTPPVSVVVPAYNESKVIVQTVESLLAQEYGGPLEVVVVDDGSRDDTAGVAERAFAGNPQVSVYRKPNGGKASALNHGIGRARHEIVVALDADTIFAPDTVAELVQPLADPEVGAVAGNAKVGNRINLVTRWQALEYVTSQNLDRRAFSLLDCITVVPGAVGAWRRSVVRRVGGFRDDTLAEDQDLTLAVRRAGYSIAYADGAVAYTEAPDTLRGLAKQRFRWSFGTLQCAWKHRDALFRKKYGSLGSIALPNVWLFQLLLPAISPIADLMFVWSLFSVYGTWQMHGETYALTNLTQVLFYYAVFLFVDWVAAVIGFLMEPGEERQLTWLIFLQRFAYRQVMYWVVVRSFAAALRGHVVGWGKLERKATVELPELAAASGGARE